MRVYPALDVTWPRRPDDERIERLLAEIDEDAPIAVEDRPEGVRVFFASAAGREQAQGRLAALDAALTSAAVDVPDDDWAERSQAALGPVRVGRIVVAPPENDLGGRFHAETTPEVVSITIARSMGFGTGHHASTRLCLGLLQRLPLGGTNVLDVGTGSGVLAIASWRLGAARVLAIDCDPDALTAAQENVERNGAGPALRLVLQDVSDLADTQKGSFDVVLANLTGTLLVRQSARLSALASRAGHLILSGIMREEAGDVIAAFTAEGRQVIAREDEDDWVGLLLATSPTSSTAR